MSHRISMKRALEIDKNRATLEKLQREGKPLPKNDRRRKKYLDRIKKQQGFIAYLKARGGYYKLDPYKEAKK